MFVKSLQDDFYKVVHGKQCLLLVNFDIDAICASKILQALFKNDSIVYTLVPVQGVQDMVKAYMDNAEEIEYIVMINCGGTIDIVEYLHPEEKVIFFILDSHRPYDLCNIYNEKQVQILGDPTAEDDIPEYTDVFNDESSDEEEEEDEDILDDENESHQAKRRRLAEMKILKKRERRQWEQKRDTIMFNYTQYSYYGKSSALVAFELTWHMSRDNLDMLWWAIVGSTEQSILNKVESGVSLLGCDVLHKHVSRLSHSKDANQQLSAIKITYDKDLQLALYRHWTVENSLRHSMTTAVALRLWSLKGEQRLKELLAEMGLPLAQSRQRFSSMDLNLRQEFKNMVEKLADKYKVGSIVGANFTMQYGYRFKYCASDIVYAMLSILESTTRDRQPELCFLEASDCLLRTKKEVLDKGVDKAKNMLTIIYKTAQSILELKQVINAGSFLYVILSEGVLNCHLFSHPHALIMLAQFTLRAYVEASRSKRAKTWPLVASATFSEEEGTCLIVGVPPTSEEQPRSLFGRAFELTAKNTNSNLEADYFDATIARLKTEDRPKFFDALAALLIE